MFEVGVEGKGTEAVSMVWAATDGQVGRLVYGLPGLTGDEIKTAEEATRVQ